MAKRYGLFALLLSGALASSLCGPASAQSYPTRPIELVSPTSAGSGTDIYARALAEIVRREKLLPQPFVVQNRTGGASVIAYNYFLTRIRKTVFRIESFTVEVIRSLQTRSKPAAVGVQG